MPQTMELVGGAVHNCAAVQSARQPYVAAARCACANNIVFTEAISSRGSKIALRWGTREIDWLTSRRSREALASGAIGKLGIVSMEGLTTVNFLKVPVANRTTRAVASKIPSTWRTLKGAPKNEIYTIY